MVIGCPPAVPPTVTGARSWRRRQSKRGERPCTADAPGPVRWVKNIRHSQTCSSLCSDLRTALAEQSKPLVTLRAGALVQHPPHRFHLVGPQLPRRPQNFPLLACPLRSVVRPARDGCQLLVCHPGWEQRQHLPEEGLGAPPTASMYLLHWASTSARERIFTPPVPQIADGPDGVPPGCRRPSTLISPVQGMLSTSP